MSYLTIEQLVEQVAIDLITLRRLEEDGLIEPELGDGGALLYSESQIERVRIARDLLDLGVNEEGIEIILSMRDQLLGVQSLAYEVLSVLKEDQTPDEAGQESVARIKKVSVSILSE